MAISTVNSALHSARALGRAASFRGTLALALTVALALVALLPTAQVNANTAADIDVLRVDVPLERTSFRDGELKISALIANNTYIDVEEFNLRAIELEASSTRDGEVRLKVGRYVTPPVPLPGPNNEGLLRIEAPHKSNKSWRLLIEDRINITSLTAVLEPRDDDSDYYESRYETRGYTLGRDYNYRPWSRSRHDNWPYNWLNNSYDYNRRSAHWFWLNNPRSRYHFNPGYGHNHRHAPRCYDRFGRHISFNNSFGRNRSERSRDLGYYRGERRSRDNQGNGQNSGDRDLVTGPRQQRPVRNPNREPVMRTPVAPQPSNSRRITTRDQAVRNQAAQAQLQQRMLQAQARADAQRRQQAARQQPTGQQRQQRQQRRDAGYRRNSQAMGPRSARPDRSQQRPRSTMQRASKGQRQDP